MKGTLPLLAVVLLAACGTIDQRSSPVSTPTAKEICVIANPKVSQPEFGEVFMRELRSKGFNVSVVSPDSTITACPLLATYTANFLWDLALYLAYAEFKVFQDGRQIGEAVYDARRAGLKTSKFIKAGEKIAELVALLFPKGPA